MADNNNGIKKMPKELFPIKLKVDRYFKF